MNTRSKLVKLAYDNPELRADLLPLLRMAGGSGIGRLKPSRPLKSLDDVEVGTLLISTSKKFDAVNVARVTKVDNWPQNKEGQPREIIYAIYVNPDNPRKPRLPTDREFAIWDYELKSKEYQTVRAAAYENPELREDLLPLLKKVVIAGAADGVDKELLKLIKNVKSGKGVDPRSMEEFTDGELLSMFLRPVIQSAAMNLKDPRGFFKGIRMAHDKQAGAVYKTILDQMGGQRRLMGMIGANNFVDLGKGVGFRWPNKQRSKGNYVEIKLTGTDLYDMTFFNLSMKAKKKVKEHRGLYFDMLVDTFEGQTGWYLRLGSKNANFDPEIIGAESDGALKNDADEDSYMGKNFSGQIFRELADRQEAGELADGQSILDQRVAEPGRKGINASARWKTMPPQRGETTPTYLWDTALASYTVSQDSRGTWTGTAFKHKDRKLVDLGTFRNEKEAMKKAEQRDKLFFKLEKTSRLHKRHEKVLEKYLKGLGSRASHIQDYDDLPEPIQNALDKVKWHESLWSDVNRWLSDNNNPHLSKWAADTEWAGVVTVKAMISKSELHRSDKSVPGKYEYSVKAKNKRDAEEAVLDEFHDGQAIKVLDDFDIEVKLKKQSSISRGKLVRLAYENPEMRAEILPLIKTAYSAKTKKQMNAITDSKGKTVTIEGEKRKVKDVRWSSGNSISLTLDKPLKGKTSPLYTVVPDKAFSVKVGATKSATNWI